MTRTPAGVARALVVALPWVLGTASVRAQSPGASASTPPTESGFTVTVGWEIHRDRQHYGFENPSSIDTPFLVPHRFDQTYVADNQWLVAAVHYRVFGDAMLTEFGATPQKTIFASDLDAFDEPNGDVIVSGTASDASMHSLRFAHWSEATLWGLPWRVGYVYRRDVAEFHATERIVTNTMPPSESRTPIHSHETTISEVHEIPVGVAKQVPIAPRWVLTGGADVAPVTIAKLTTILPEKYPGQEIVFSAKVAALDTRIDLDWQRASWPVSFSLRYGHTWSYQSSNQFDRDLLQFAVRIGLTP